MWFFILGVMVLCGLLPLQARPNRAQDSAMEGLRLELADVKHALKSAQVELTLLEERVQKQDSALKTSQGGKITLEGSQLIAQISALDRKISQLEKTLEKASVDVRTLSTHTHQVLTKLHALEEEIASHEKRLEEVAKLKGTLTSISKAMGTEESPGKTHRVKAGDSLEKISRNYSVSIEELKRWNRLHNDKIIVGQELKVCDDTR